MIPYQRRMLRLPKSTYSSFGGTIVDAITRFTDNRALHKATAVPVILLERSVPTTRQDRALGLWWLVFDRRRCHMWRGQCGLPRVGGG